MEKEELQELIFVYNANSGMGNALLDGAHKILDPSTYTCSLCQLTHGAFREREIWKKYRTASSISMLFLHKDEFEKEYASKFGHAFTYPIILGETNSGLQVVVRAGELKALPDANALIALLESRS